VNMDTPTDTGQTLAGQLREKPIIRDAAVLDGPEPDGLTVMVVRQGYRPGPVFRDLVMRLAGERSGTIRVAIVPEIPRDAAGVVDQGAAHELLRQRSLILVYEPPACDSERRLAELVRQVLPQTSVSMTDDLVSLGGDSLVAVELVALIHQQWGIEVGGSDLFAAESIRDMAAVIARSAGSAA
jgi:acyl carrier protein